MVYAVMSFGCSTTPSTTEIKNPKKEVIALATEIVLALLLATAGALAILSTTGQNLGFLSCVGNIPTNMATIMQGAAAVWILANVVIFCVKNLRNETSAVQQPNQSGALPPPRPPTPTSSPQPPPTAGSPPPPPPVRTGADGKLAIPKPPTAGSESAPGASPPAPSTASPAPAGTPFPPVDDALLAAITRERKVKTPEPQDVVRAAQFFRPEPSAADYDITTADFNVIKDKKKFPGAGWVEGSQAIADLTRMFQSNPTDQPTLDKINEQKSIAHKLLKAIYDGRNNVKGFDFASIFKK